MKDVEFPVPGYEFLEELGKCPVAEVIQLPQIQRKEDRELVGSRRPKKKDKVVYKLKWDRQLGCGLKALAASRKRPAAAVEADGAPPAKRPSAAAARENADYWVREGEFLRRMHVQPRTHTFMPAPGDPFLQGLVLDDWRMTSVLTNCQVEQDEWINLPWSMPQHQQYQVQAEPWTGASTFQVQNRRRTRLKLKEGKGRRRPGVLAAFLTLIPAATAAT
eukprot:s839_g17.t1